MAEGTKKGGRPRANISRELFEKLCGIQCTKMELCAVLGVSDKTLDAWAKRTYKKRFSEVYAEKRSIGHASLRRTQWQMAEKSAAMAIFLGKQYLGQTDTPHIDDNGDDKVTVVIDV